MNKKYRTLLNVPCKQIDPLIWGFPKNYNSEILVAGCVCADEELLSKIIQNRTLDQCANYRKLWRNIPL